MDSTSQANEHTAAWAAPELLAGADTATQEADVFAFGMVVIEVCPCHLPHPVLRGGSSDIVMLSKVFTGRHPFGGLTTPVITSRIMDGGRPARPQEARELGLTDSVWDMTVRCWHQDPVQRPTMTEVVGLVRRWPVFALSPWN